MNAYVRKTEIINNLKNELRDLQSLSQSQKKMYNKYTSLLSRIRDLENQIVIYILERQGFNLDAVDFDD